jgi:hypothetical protein
LINKKDWDSVSDLSKPPTSHLIINFCIKLGVPSDKIPLKLCTDEVHASAWLSEEQLVSIFCQIDGEQLVRGTRFENDAFIAHNFRLEEFFPYFPNHMLSGIGKASIYALKYFVIYKA